MYGEEAEVEGWPAHLTMSTAILSAAAPVRFPLRVCSMKSLPS
jgi:hypothetical protein